MTITSPDKKWFDEFIVELRLRDVLGRSIGDAVASARELLDDTGQSAMEAFGPARNYAASLELPRESGKGWSSRRLWSSVLGFIAFMLYVQAFSAWARSEVVLISPAQLALLGAPVVLIAFLPLYVQIMVRRPWLVAPFVFIGGALGYLASTAAPATSAEAWLALDPLPWLSGSALAMILMSLWSTVQTLGRGNMDDITEPMTALPMHSLRGSRAIVMLTNWLFPAFAAIMSLMMIFLFTR